LTQQPANREARWRLRGSQDFAWAAFDDGFVLYHRPSGTTHLLNDGMHHLLTRVIDGNAAFSEIADAFAEVAADADRAEYLASLRAMLDRMVELGFIERVDPAEQ
jgi:PqqD family protein of HPr-rel-A system